MHFQGEICTVSYGLHFDEGQVLINGVLWPRRSAAADPHPLLPRFRFNGLFPEQDILALQHWLLTDSQQPLDLPNAIRQVRRLDTPDADTIHLELELRFDQAPAWWDWPLRFPLCVRLAIHSGEFAYLAKSLSREHWSTDLAW